MAKGAKAKKKKHVPLEPELRKLGLADKKIDLIMRWLDGEIDSLNITFTAKERPWRVEALLREELIHRTGDRMDKFLVQFSGDEPSKKEKKQGISKMALYTVGAFPVKKAGMLPYVVRKERDAMHDEMIGLNIPVEIRTKVIAYIMGESNEFPVLQVADKEKAFVVYGYLKKKAIERGLLLPLIKEVEKGVWEVSAVPVKKTFPQVKTGPEMPETWKEQISHVEKNYTVEVKDKETGKTKKKEIDAKEKGQQTVDELVHEMEAEWEEKLEKKPGVSVEVEVEEAYADPWDAYAYGDFASHAMFFTTKYLSSMGKYKVKGKVKGEKGKDHKMDALFRSEIFLGTKKSELDLSAAAPEFRFKDVTAMAGFLQILYGGMGYKRSLANAEAEAKGEKPPYTYVTAIEEEVKFSRMKKKTKTKDSMYMVEEAIKREGGLYELLESFPVDVKLGLLYAAPKLTEFIYAQYIKVHGEPASEEKKDKLWNACYEAAAKILLANLYHEIGREKKWMEAYTVQPGEWKVGKKWSKKTFKLEKPITARRGQFLVVRGLEMKNYICYPTDVKGWVLVVGTVEKGKMKLYDDPKKYKTMEIKDRDSLGYSQFSPLWTKKKFPIVKFKMKWIEPWMDKKTIKEMGPVDIFDVEANLATTAGQYFEGRLVEKSYADITEMKIVSLKTGKETELLPQEFLNRPDTEMDYVLSYKPVAGENLFYAIVTPELMKKHGPKGDGIYEWEDKKARVKYTSRLEDGDVFIYMKDDKLIDAKYGYENKDKEGIKEIPLESIAYYKPDENGAPVLEFEEGYEYKGYVVSHVTGKELLARADEDLYKAEAAAYAGYCMAKKKAKPIGKVKVDVTEGKVTVPLLAAPHVSAEVEKKKLRAKVYTTVMTPETFGLEKVMKPGKEKVVEAEHGTMTTEHILYGPSWHYNKTIYSDTGKMPPKKKKKAKTYGIKPAKEKKAAKEAQKKKEIEEAVGSAGIVGAPKKGGLLGVGEEVGVKGPKEGNALIGFEGTDGNLYLFEFKKTIFPKPEMVSFDRLLTAAKAGQVLLRDKTGKNLSPTTLDLKIKKEGLKLKPYTLPW